MKCRVLVLFILRSEDISKQLNSYGFKPVETDSDWKEYWAFQKALEKGDSVVGRGRKSIGGAKKRQGSGRD
jgi:hypothetical protein